MILRIERRVVRSDQSLRFCGLKKEKSMSLQVGSSLREVKCGKCGKDIISPVYRDGRMVCSGCYDKSLIEIRSADEVAARFGFAPSPRGGDAPTF